MNPIESTFATVRLRTKVTKGPGSRAAGLAMVFKLLQAAEEHWRYVNGAHLVALVRAGTKFEKGALVKVSSVASKLTTVSAQDMIKAMIVGQRDPRVLAALARTRMKAKHDDLVEALDGMFDDHHGELAQLLLDQITVLDAKITQLGARAAELTAAMPATWGVNGDGTTGPRAGTGPDAPVLNTVARLAEIPGVSPDLARSIIAEVGLDMSPACIIMHRGLHGDRPHLPLSAG